MEELSCNTRGCQTKIEYYNSEENSYYCGICAYSFLQESEFEKIGSVDIIKHMIDLSKNLLDKIQEYTRMEQLTIKWKKVLDQHTRYYNELELIRKELEETLIFKKLSNLLKIQKRSANLKSQIIVSEAYRKYHIHKDISEFRNKDMKIEGNPPVNKEDTDVVRYEEKKAVAREDFLEPESYFNLELEGRQNEEDKDNDDNDIPLLFGQRQEDANEEKETEDIADFFEDREPISYDIIN